MCKVDLQYPYELNSSLSYICLFPSSHCGCRQLSTIKPSISLADLSSPQYPHLLRVLDCGWNFRITHCRLPKFERRCLSAERDGVSLLHGAGQHALLLYDPLQSIETPKKRLWDPRFNVSTLP